MPDSEGVESVSDTKELIWKIRNWFMLLLQEIRTGWRIAEKLWSALGSLQLFWVLSCDNAKIGEIKLLASWKHKKVCCFREMYIWIRFWTHLMPFRRLWLSVLEERGDCAVAECLLMKMQFLLCKQLCDSNTYLAFSMFFQLLPFNHSWPTSFCFSFQMIHLLLKLIVELTRWVLLWPDYSTYAIHYLQLV